MPQFPADNTASDNAAGDTLDQRESAPRPLHGGNTPGVAQVGNTVRRPINPWTHTVHDLLRQARSRGATFLPAPRGIDDGRREILDFIDGNTVLSRPDWLWHRDTLNQAATTLRAFHRATEQFHPPEPATWGFAPETPEEVICHNDNRKLSYSPQQCLDMAAKRVAELAVWTEAKSKRQHSSHLSHHAAMYRKHAAWLKSRSAQ